LRLTTATMAQMLIVAGPAITLLAGIALGKERGTPLKWLGIALAAAGALALVGAVPSVGRLGNLFIVANIAVYSVYLVLTRDIVLRYRPITVITWIFIFGTLALIPVGAGPLTRELGAISLTARLCVVWIILFPTVAAYYLNVWALQRVESSFVSTFVYVQPVLTAMLAYPILGERPSLRMLPGAALIFGGVGVAIHEQRLLKHAPSVAEQAVVEV
jgi:drug/metabolite transporter (DMT)-like permease